MGRQPDIDWSVPNGQVSVDQAQLAVLMDIRGELRILNRLLGCTNFQDIPEILRAVRRNTAKPRAPKKGHSK